MRIAYLECFAGIAGDMFLGALVDAGVEVRLLQDAADALNLGVSLDFQKVDRSGIQSTKARVLINGRDADGGLVETAVGHSHSHTHTHSQADGTSISHTHSHAHSHAHDEHTHTHAQGQPHVHGRSLSEIRTLISNANLSNEAKQTALTAFELLGAAEAKVHGVPVEQIHFHEVGAVDAIIDIVCSAVGAHSLGVDQWHGTAVNTGSGFVECAHGRFPVPTPATIELLKGVPTYADGPAKELTTPTGAALLRALGCKFDEMPRLSTEAIGYGAGTRNPERFPNVLRLRVGQSSARDIESNPDKDTITVLECAIDDATPEVLAHAAQRLMDHGALDVMQQPVMMKKGRQGTLLTVLCTPGNAALFEDLLFRETTTLGIRTREEQRTILTRGSRIVDTAFGPIRVKIGMRAGEVLNTAPEFEDCKAAAQAHGVPLKEVMHAAISAALVVMEPAR